MFALQHHDASVIKSIKNETNRFAEHEYLGQTDMLRGQQNPRYAESDQNKESENSKHEKKNVVQAQVRVAKIGIYMAMVQKKIAGWDCNGKKAKEGQWNKVDRCDEQQKQTDDRKVITDST